MSTDDHVPRNRATWDALATEYMPAAERDWATDEITREIWGVPEAQLRVAPTTRASSCWRARKRAG